MDITYDINVRYSDVLSLKADFSSDISDLEQYGTDAVNALGGNTDIANAIRDGMVEVNLKNIQNSLNSLEHMNTNFQKINDIYSDAHTKILSRIRSGGDAPTE